MGSACSSDSCRAEHLAGFTAYHTHLKRAKRRLLAIQHAAPQATGQRRAAYRDLVALARATGDYATAALVHVAASGRPRTTATSGCTPSSPTIAGSSSA